MVEDYINLELLALQMMEIVLPTINHFKELSKMDAKPVGVTPLTLWLIDLVSRKVSAISYNQVRYDSDNSHLKHMWKNKYFTQKYFYTYERVQWLIITYD